MIAAISKNEGSEKSEGITCNYSDDELILKELYLKCKALENEKNEKKGVKQNLVVLKERNENISKSLLKIKTELELYKSNLYKTLFNLNVSAEKQKILSRKKLDDFLKKSHTHQEYLTPKKQELDYLLSRNNQLEEDYKSQTDLMILTQKEFDELRESVMQTFQKKVCEFCDIVLRLNK